jgi:hypothetical protein
VVIERGDDLMIEQIRFDPESRQLSVRRTVIRDGAVQTSRYGVRLYDFAQIGALLESVGFTHVVAVDEPAAVGPHAHRLVIDARRPKVGQS